MSPTSVRRDRGIALKVYHEFEKAPDPFSNPFKLDDLGRPESRVINVLSIMSPTEPNMVWAGDFTYLWVHDRFWYLATAIDVYTPEIVRWHVANHHTTTNSLILTSAK